MAEKTGQRLKRFSFRNTRGGINFLPIAYDERHETVFDIVTLLKDNAGLFSLRGDDINYNNTCVFAVDGDDTKRKVEFDTLVSTFSENQRFEFDPRPHDDIDIFVKYIKSSNSVKVTCSASDPLLNLVNKCKDNIKQFCLSKEDEALVKASGNEILLFLSAPVPGVENNPLDQRLAINKVDHSRGFTFKINKEFCIAVFVKYIDSANSIMFTCHEGDLLLDLVKKCKGEIERFCLSKKNEALVKAPENEILLFLSAPVPGVENNPLDQRLAVNMVDHSRGFTFDLKNRNVDISELQFKGQTIALLGAPSHGKSSFINTSSTAFTGRYQNRATSYDADTASMETTLFPIPTEMENTAMIDIPGITEKNENDNIIERLLDGKLAVGKKHTHKAAAQGWFFRGDKVMKAPNAIIIIQKGDAEPSWCSKRVIDITKARGSITRVFAIITHLDKIEEEVQERIATFSRQTGLDKSAIFAITNYSQSDMEKGQLDRERNRYILSIWKYILDSTPC